MLIVKTLHSHYTANLHKLKCLAWTQIQKAWTVVPKWPVCIYWEQESRESIIESISEWIKMVRGVSVAEGVGIMEES